MPPRVADHDFKPADGIGKSGNADQFKKLLLAEAITNRYGPALNLRLVVPDGLAWAL